MICPECGSPDPDEAFVSEYLVNPAAPFHEHVRVQFSCAAGEGPHAPPTDWWAVRYMGRCLTSKGEWVFEPQPSSRTRAFLNRTRFDRDRALELARARVARGDLLR